MSNDNDGVRPPPPARRAERILPPTPPAPPAAGSGDDLDQIKRRLLDAEAELTALKADSSGKLSKADFEKQWAALVETKNKLNERMEALLKSSDPTAVDPVAAPESDDYKLGNWG